ncbi:tetratricopeptide repeat protein [Marinitoga sp. 38H-ov]|uniref:tetratricopeptide repeat protein n=1 Tax=Marinitoga sp. 38H-ov TaxID=1755814 RepID=UPI0013ED11B0|nr:tetratricopeptide repeat protein [Marinitoga sp. 38H-ov]KAF2956508.1 hypothetical protein AS160_05630 [Marinitoga sp. 38H-ov]
MQNKSNYFIKLGNKYLSLNNIKLAIENYLLALKEDEENPLIYHNLGVCFLLENNYNDAVVNFEKSIEKGMDEEETYYYYIKALYLSGNYNECLEVNVNEKFYIDMNIIKLKSAMKLNKFDIAKNIIENLKLKGFSSQEINLIESIISNQY